MGNVTQRKSENGLTFIPQLLDETKALANTPRKASQREPSVANANTVYLHELPIAKAKKLASDASERIAKALTEDSDPAKLLTEVREVLFGPTKKLQEARLEEFVVILEQLDRETQAANKSFTEQVNALHSADQQQSVDLLASNQRAESFAARHERDLSIVGKKFDALSERLASELSRRTDVHKREIDEQAEQFNSLLDRQSAIIFKQMSDMAEQHQIALQSVSAEFTKHLKELAFVSQQNDDKIVSRMDGHVNLMQSNAEDEKRRNIKVMTEGLNSLAERLQAL